MGLVSGDAVLRVLAVGLLAARVEFALAEVIRVEDPDSQLAPVRSFFCLVRYMGSIAFPPTRLGTGSGRATLLDIHESPGVKTTDAANFSGRTTGVGALDGGGAPRRSSAACRRSASSSLSLIDRLPSCSCRADLRCMMLTSTSLAATLRSRRASAASVWPRASAASTSRERRDCTPSVARPSL